MDFLHHFDTAADRLGEVLATGDLSAPVPACPGWTLADLGAHTGRIHQWAEHAVIAGHPDDSPLPAPTGQAELAQWYRGCARSLRATLRNADPGAEAWSFGPKPGRVAFWHRRQAHETSMHLVDALASQNTPPSLDDEEFATDGIHEVFEVFVPRQERLGRRRESRHLLQLSTGPDWWTIGDTSGLVGSVSGPPSAVLLLLWGRIALDDDRLEVSGDREAALAVLTSGLVP
jgi:uncharacterized protein (TIGR03083 family)